tara:strand:+ start:386 stop:526 length:141 start_codon:yes stop_codon:yes gene_type:complete
MNSEQLIRLVETPLKSLANHLEKEGQMKGLTAEVIAHILKNLREYK